MTKIIQSVKVMHHYISMIKRTLFALCAVVMTASLVQPAEACNECHSKNPKMVKMHEALGFKDCFKCHGPMGRVKKGEEQKTQMRTDPLCTNCHNKQP